MAQVSIVIPIKNEAEYIGVLIEGIQTVSAGNADFEIIVVDDSSTDNSAVAVRVKTTDMSNLRLLRRAR